MDSIILIFICLLAGWGLQRVKTVPANAHTALNQFVIYISLPALSLYYIPKIQINAGLLYPIGIAWIGFLLSWLFFAGLGKAFNWPKKLVGCLAITAGFANTSFIGFPVIEALYGKGGLKTAIIVDQPGTFVVVSTFGILLAAAYSKGSGGGSGIARKILLFPPFIAFVVAAGMNVFGYDFISTLQNMFTKLGSTVTPVALVAVGLQLKIERKSQYWGFLGIGLLFKLLLMPLFFFILYKILLGAEGQVIDVSIMEAAMAPMITAAILASAHGLKPRLAGMMIGVGIPLSFITLAMWYFILKFW
ncbi:AEC family transporter [Flavobacterium subsaxonicum]|uniref:Transporter n=1 Tax=Flavobacterium subsaxonicum WB 4.1-42 = DSM 21790 TaxID=1121898 RepID=A0A0A2MLL7_9FLAO|nr:AEC family transporter [Flavobacterium subsaxonicum]KGO92383.1 transporter [Flavobacterium subsaxonicum WB 4.1-42 = DSM 21790]